MAVQIQMKKWYNWDLFDDYFPKCRFHICLKIHWEIRNQIPENISECKRNKEKIMMLECLKMKWFLIFSIILEKRFPLLWFPFVWLLNWDSICIMLDPKSLISSIKENKEISIQEIIIQEIHLLFPFVTVQMSIP